MEILPRFLRFRLASAAILLSSFFCLAHLATPHPVAASLTLTWNDNSDNEEGFTIERQIDGGRYAEYAVVGPDITSFVDSGMNDGSGYCYRVSAYNSAGSSDFTNEECAYGLIVSKSGTGMGTLTAAGINCGTDCAETYPIGETVVLSATPSGGSVFAGWGGDADCSDGVVTISASVSCTATFDVAPPPPVTLTVSVVSIANAYGSGVGVVTSSPAGIDCGADCGETYPNGTSVSLTATPTAGSVFAGWSGDSDCSDGLVTMSAAVSCTASFEVPPPPPATLSVSVISIANVYGSGAGVVTSSPAGIDCGADCAEEYPNSELVTLTALPERGSKFAGWNAEGCGASSTCTLTVATDKSVSASFEPETFALTVSVSGNGTVTASGVDCGADCEETYGSGTEVTLTAVPDAGWQFSGWSEQSCEVSTVCTTHMSEDTHITAIFELLPPGWNDYEINFAMSSQGDGALGVVFRYQDNRNYYRFSWDQQRGYRQLVKQEAGVFTLLDSDAVPYATGQTYQVSIVADGAELEVWIDDALVFAVSDSSLSEGALAFYSWANAGAYFDDITVHHLPTGAVLLDEKFDDGDLDGWTVIDEGNRQGPSSWSVENGTLVQGSTVHDGSGLAKFGTYLYYGLPETLPARWTDQEIFLTMRSQDNDIIGVMFRYQDPYNYYRFSWDRERFHYALVKRENGVFSLVAWGLGIYQIGQTYDLHIVADGSNIEVWINNFLAVDVVDPSLSEGTMALYNWANTGSYFDDIVVNDLSTGTRLLAENFDDGSLDGWTIFDDGDTGGPSSWSASSGMLVQSSDIHSFTSPWIARLGTFALYR